MAAAPAMSSYSSLLGVAGGGSSSRASLAGGQHLPHSMGGGSALGPGLGPASPRQGSASQVGASRSASGGHLIGLEQLSSAAGVGGRRHGGPDPDSGFNLFPGQSQQDPAGSGSGSGQVYQDPGTRAQGGARRGTGSTDSSVHAGSSSTPLQPQLQPYPHGAVGAGAWPGQGRGQHSPTHHMQAQAQQPLHQHPQLQHLQYPSRRTSRSNQSEAGRVGAGGEAGELMPCLLGDLPLDSDAPVQLCATPLGSSTLRPDRGNEHW